MTLFLVVLAACMAVASEYLLTRANPGVRLPLWRGRPPCNPTSARVLRGLAGGSAVFAAINPSDDIAWRWGVALIVGVFLPALLVRLVQNSRVRAQPVH